MNVAEWISVGISLAGLLGGLCVLIGLGLEGSRQARRRRRP